MKKILTFVAFCYVAGPLLAQNPVENDFYLLTPMMINPSLTGRNGDPAFTLASRVPTVGIDGAPQQYLLTYEQGIKAINSGVGATVGHQSVGIHSIWRYSLAYNYRFKLSRGNKLALGGSAFHHRMANDFGRLLPPGGGPRPTGITKLVSYSYHLGLSYFFKKSTTIGVSLINYRESERNVLVFAEKNFRVNKWLKLTPSVLFIAPGSLPAVWNLNAIADIGKWAFVGARYSNSDGIDYASGAFAGVSFQKFAKVGVNLWSKKPTMFPETTRGLSFMLQVSPGKFQKETL